MTETTDRTELRTQACPADRHEPWTTAYTGIQDCPWCQVEEMAAAQARLVKLLRERQRWQNGRLVAESGPEPREVRKAFGWPAPQSADISRETANHVLYHFGSGGYPADGFTTNLVYLLATAKGPNAVRLAETFPEYAAAMRLASDVGDGADRLRAIAAGS
jgi:hypothetical protein